MDNKPQPFLERIKYVVFLAIAAAIGAGILVLLLRRPEPTTITVIPPGPTLTPQPTLIPSLTPTPGPYTVYITGAVANPEMVVTLPYGSRVADALKAAGGPRDDANLERVNLAQILADGDQVHVPTQEVGAKTTVILSTQAATPGLYRIYVTGEVVRPESLINLPAGSRVEDALKAVGGTTDNADLNRVNLSQVLNDGDMVYVPPLVGEAIQTPTLNHPLVIHINLATVEELTGLPEIGPTLAQAIIDYRAQNGPFHSLEDLDDVPGIGPSTLEAVREFLVFD